MRNHLLIAAFIVAVPMALLACKESNFKGGSDKKPATSNSLPTSSPEPIVNLPAGAVTKGSFTVWTEPKDPQPKQRYEIHILVNLPSGASSFAHSNLSGNVKGTDGYSRSIGPVANVWEQVKYPGWPKDVFTHLGSTAKLVMTIPGAEILVKDTINVKSSASFLNEEQTISIEF